jgi:tetratricopeptide (TPR) repeat protein
MKNQEKHEICVFQSIVLIKDKKYEEALNFLLENQTNFLDKTFFTEKVIEMAMILGKKDLALEYINKAFQINSENSLYFIHYFNLKGGLNITSFENLLKFSNDNGDKSKELIQLLQTDLKPRIKSRIINRLELALSQGSEFKEIFSLYFLQNVKQNLPSFFINVKFVYLYQQNKIPIIEEVLTAHLNSIKESGKLDSELAKGETSVHDIVPSLIWVYYYAAQHFDKCRNLEKALEYINKAIDSTPSVVEFYMVKSKILKHAGLLVDSAAAYEKAKRLDLGDRYLNAKYAKIYARMGDVTKSVEIMKEFVRDPLTDENIEHFQCMWYESECGYAYLRNKEKSILRAHRLFKSIISHFQTLIEDQFAFYNYNLRRYMLNDFAKTIDYMDRIQDTKYVYKSIEIMEVILQYLKSNSMDVKELQKSFEKDYEEMKKEKIEKYKFTDIPSLITDIENDIYNVALRLQPYSKSISFHHSCVKSFLNKGRILLAFKSLLFLQNHCKHSFEFVDALNKFNSYLFANKEKLNAVNLEIIYGKLSLLKDQEAVQKFVKSEMSRIREELISGGSLIEELLIEAYQTVFNNSQSPEKVLEKLHNLDPIYLRTIKSEVTIITIIF